MAQSFDGGIGRGGIGRGGIGRGGIGRGGVRRPVPPARRGVVLLAVACLLALVLAAGGLILDLSRVISGRNALQSQVDAAALAAVLELDGTLAGLDRARGRAASGAGRTGFRATSVRCEFARQSSGPWEETPAAAGQIRLVRVTGLAPVPLTLVRAMVRNNASQVWASAIAEQRPKTTFDEGLFPYSPLAPRIQEPPHYGLQRDQLHTLRWAEKPALETGNVCAGDATQALIDYARAERDTPVGFIEMNGRTHIRQAILWDTQSYVRRVGDSIRGTGGVRPLEVAALIERISQDTDASSFSYAEYTSRGRGNGRRIVAVPVHTPYPDSRIVQIGAFFLLPPSEYPRTGDHPFCAEYLGPYVQGARRRGAADAGFHVAVLLR